MSERSEIELLFVLGTDDGHWRFLWVESAMILLLHGRSLPARVEARIVSQMDTFLGERSLNRLGRNEWVFLLFGVPVLWSLMDFLTAGPVPHHVWDSYGPF